MATTTDGRIVCNRCKTANRWPGFLFCEPCTIAVQAEWMAEEELARDRLSPKAFVAYIRKQEASIYE